MISNERYSDLLEKLNNKEILIEDNNIYFMGKINGINGIMECSVLCKLEIKEKKQYFINKNKNHITDNVEIFNEYLEKKKAGVRGYKTAKMGVIEKYNYADVLEYAVRGSDIDGFYWWIDWENKVQIFNYIGSRIASYINSLTSEFISE